MFIQDVKWFFPNLKTDTYVAVPLEDGPEPVCAYFVKEANKVKDIDRRFNLRRYYGKT